MKDLIKKYDVCGLGDVFDDMFKPMFFERKPMMKTDIKENEKEYEFEIDMPGFAKDQINVTFEKGYLQVSAKKEQVNESKNGYIRRERDLAYARTYFVGEKVRQDEIKAKYENGVLTLNIPKEQPKQEPEHKITIE